jgi:hypothetical protein
MNKDNVGELFYYPNTFLFCLDTSKYNFNFHIDKQIMYRIRRNHGKVFLIPNYTTLTEE